MMRHSLQGERGGEEVRESMVTSGAVQGLPTSLVPSLHSQLFFHM